MIINTNVSALITRNYLQSNNDRIQETMEKLASGRRINKASDDAAGLSIATRMDSQIRGMDVAMRNAGDGISLIQTAESAMGSVVDILQRMRELSVQADNGTYSTSDLASLQKELEALVEEIDHIAGNTQFNGVKLLDNTDAVKLHISDLATDVVNVTMSDLQTSVLGSTTVKVDAIDISTGTGAQDAISSIDAALDQISTARAGLGAMQNRLNFTIDNLSVASQNTSAAKSRIEDADMAAETSKLTRDKILTQSSIAMLSQANQSPQMILQLLQG